MPPPNFFLVGAPKSGTTAMDQFLGTHPEILMCPRKEAHYFGSDIADHFRTDYTLDEYLKLFAVEGAADAKRIGEASVWYLYSREAAREIHEFSPLASIVIMLRNPVDMVYSLHSHFLYMGTESVEDFDAALALDSERERGSRERQFVPSSYRSAASYADQVERYLNLFGAEQVHVILYDDFRDNQVETYQQLCRDLSVDHEYVPETGIVNPSQTVRSRGLRQLTRRPPPAARRMVRAVTTRSMRDRVYKTLVKVNTRPRPREPMSPETRARLTKEFATDIERLEQMTGRNLSRWKDPPGYSTP